MALRLMTVLLLSFTLHNGAFAADLSLDTEDISAESDGAMAQTKGVKAHMANERNEADQAHKAAVKARDSAVAKRQQAIDRLKESETEIQNLGADQTKLKGEVEQLKAETAAAEKNTQENKLKAEKAKSELQTLQDLKTELTKKIAALNVQRDKAILEIRDMEESKALDNHSFQRLKENEREAREALEKTKLEQAQKRADIQGKPLNAAVTPNAIPAAAAAGEAAPIPPAGRMPIAEDKTESAELSATAVAAPVATVSAPVKPSVTESAAAPRGLAASGSDVEMTLKRDCKIFDRPTKGPKILGMKFSGTSVRKSEEGKGWVAFPLTGGQKGYVAKTCF